MAARAAMGIGTAAMALALAFTASACSTPKCPPETAAAPATTEERSPQAEPATQVKPWMAGKGLRVDP